MNLQDLIAAGALVQMGFDNAISKSVTWEGHTFDVKIKPDASAADFEFIYGTPKADEDSYSARRVHRYVLLPGDERIPYETARKMKNSLLVAICNAINLVHADKGAPQTKKTSRQKKSSGTN